MALATRAISTKIYAHVAKRPGPLAKLLTRSVTITLPGATIPGFTFGKKFRALTGDRFEDEAGKTVKGATHLGTIGDEQTVAQLAVWLAKARKARADGLTAAAVKLLAKACEVDLELEARVQARRLLDELEHEGEATLADAEAKSALGERDAAIATAKKLAADFAPVPLGERAKALAARLARPSATLDQPAAPSSGAPPTSGEPPVADPAPAQPESPAAPAVHE